MNPKEVVDIVKEVIPVKDAYHDALQPGAKQAGKTLETIGMVVNTLLLPIRQYVYNLQIKQERLERDLAAKLLEIPKERIVPSAPLHVVVPAIQAWSYSVECDELRNLYSNLLANAMIGDKQSSIHPGFIEVIKQMHPFEAKIFKALTATDSHPMVELRSARNKLIDKWWRFFEIGGRWKTLGTHFTLIEIDGLSIMPQPAYWQNLERLGLVRIDYTVYLSPDTKYSQIESYSMFDDVKAENEAKGRKIVFARGFVEITPFGKLFASVCLYNPS